MGKNGRNSNLLTIKKNRILFFLGEYMAYLKKNPNFNRQKSVSYFFISLCAFWKKFPL